MPFKNAILVTQFKYEKKTFWCGKSYFHPELTVYICGLNLFVGFGGGCEPGSTVSLQILMVMAVGLSHRAVWEGWTTFHCHSFLWGLSTQSELFHIRIQRVENESLVKINNPLSRHSNFPVVNRT